MADWPCCVSNRLFGDDLIFVQIRPRPLPPYPPFHSGDAIDAPPHDSPPT